VIRAFKVSGGGNDFLALAEPTRPPRPEEIVAWCARGLSHGADGVFVLTRESDRAVRMEYWNSDGRPAALCVNGTRCAARLAFELGWAKDATTVVTGAGRLAARRAGATVVALELPPPEALPRKTVVELPAGPVEGWFVTVGVPHFVHLWPDSLADCPVGELGAALRRHASFGDAGTNVDFVRFPDRNRMEIRSFERGVEAETLACGTGVLASVAVGLQLSLAKLPVAALTRGGFVLEVAGDTVDSVPSRWSLAGDARILGAVELSPESSLPSPATPIWSD
jgi:diaminopimelate epimerase